ncbi:MAG: polysaccharide lyase beta-sandwich domain-containing protein, partial [Anaerolineae bacterium]|nr:polysaccharide lyase beta-sandwich domain-containing protein [Anaerolineae bacterium]
ICRRMATVDPVHAQEYADFAARAAGAQAAGASGPLGNRHFWRSDVMVHRPGRFHASVRMHSARTFATEVWVNRENLQGYHLADGVCFLMQRGDEYHDIQPVWDWRKLPGATCRETAEPLPYGRDVSLAGSTAFVGGVSDGQVGVAVMDYDKDGVQARKAWFFLPDGWVALGAGICCTTGDPVTTSINQCLLKSEVLLLREGEVAPLTDPRLFSDNLRGVFHDGVGYYLPTPQHTVAQAAPQSGTWTSIEERSPNTAAVTQDVFSLWIEHGHRTSECAPSEDAASEDAYAYRVVPGLDDEDFAAYPDTSPVSVPANDARLQAVISSRGTLVQAVFHAAGCLILDAGVSVETSAPCALMLRRTKDGITLSVAEPTQRLETLQVCLSGHYQGCGSVVDPAVGSTTVTVHLPTAAEAGSTVQVMLQPQK